jgi:hypothetical protein
MPADVPADPMQSRPAAAATSFSAANLETRTEAIDKKKIK